MIFNLLLIPSVLFLLEWTLECTKIHGPSEMVVQFYAATPFSGVQKCMTPTPFASAHPPLINDWSPRTNLKQWISQVLTHRKTQTFNLQMCELDDGNSYLLLWGQQRCLGAWYPFLKSLHGVKKLDCKKGVCIEPFHLGYTHCEKVYINKYI